MLELVDFQPVGCKSAKKEIRELVLFANGYDGPDASVGAAKYVGPVAVVVKPGDTFETVYKRYRSRLRQDQIERRRFQRRRDSSKYDGWDRRSGSERRTA